jgi:hypothetical protein
MQRLEKRVFCRRVFCNGANVPRASQLSTATARSNSSPSDEVATTSGSLPCAVTACAQRDHNKSNERRHLDLVRFLLLLLSLACLGRSAVSFRSKTARPAHVSFTRRLIYKPRIWHIPTRANLDSYVQYDSSSRSFHFPVLVRS